MLPGIILLISAEDSSIDSITDSLSICDGVCIAAVCAADQPNPEAQPTCDLARARHRGGDPGHMPDIADDIAYTLRLVYGLNRP